MITFQCKFPKTKQSKPLTDKLTQTTDQYQSATTTINHLQIVSDLLKLIFCLHVGLSPNRAGDLPLLRPFQSLFLERKIPFYWLITNNL